MLSKDTGIARRTIQHAIMEYKNKLKTLKKVIVYAPVGNGVAYHRLYKPYLNQEDFDVKFVEKYNGEDCDVFVTNRVFGVSKLDNDAVVEQLKEKGVKIIFDIDDYWILPENHSHYHIFDKGLRDLIISNIKKADIVTTTNTFLALKIKQYNQNVEVISNNIDTSEPQWIGEKKEWSNHFGWVASSAHINDVAPFEPITKAILNGEIRRCNLVLGGFTSQSKQMQYIAAVMTRGGKINASYLPMSTPSTYGMMYTKLDVALAPLQQHDFNMAKSDLKAMEAAAHKKPIIVSEGTAYDNIPSDLIYKAVNARHWVSIIRGIINNPSEATERGLALNEWANKNRNFKDTLRKIKQILLSI